MKFSYKGEKIVRRFLLLYRKPELRLDLSLLFGGIMNAVYIAENFISAFLYKSAWSLTVTVYYLVFLLLRTYLLSSRRRVGWEESAAVKKICLRVGTLLIFLGICAISVMLYTVSVGSFAEYSGIVLFGFLVYSVYSLLSSVLGMRKFSKQRKPLSYAARNITLSSALLAVFNLEYSLLSTLNVSYRFIIRAVLLSGFSIFFVIILLSVRLVYFSRK